MNNVRLTRAGWSALRAAIDNAPGASRGGVTNAVNQGVLTRNEDDVISVTPLGREVAAHVWGA